MVVASIFVNPAQFGALEDLDRYPRDEDGDAELAAGWGVDHLFVPSVAEMYPQGFQTWVDVEAIADDLEGAGRPGHFRGVATVCLKLFNIVGPDVAYFGRKDAQQAVVVERMVRDLDLPLEIRVVETVRDPDGVAISSRNAYLSPEERAAAGAIPRALEAGADRAPAGRGRRRGRAGRPLGRGAPRPGVRPGCAAGRTPLPSGCGPRGADAAHRQRRPRRRP